MPWTTGVGTLAISRLTSCFVIFIGVEVEMRKMSCVERTIVGHVNMCRVLLTESRKLLSKSLRKWRH
jgi:hypothetical protein